MSSRAKSDDAAEKKRFFAEEQMTANTVLPIALLIIGLVGSQMGAATIPGKIWSGWTAFPTQGYLLHAFLIGIFSCGIGICGNLIYLDKRENTFTVPANRASSIMAGVIATYLLAIFFDQRFPSVHQLIGVLLIIGAVFSLSYRSIVAKRKSSKVAATQKKRAAGEMTTDGELTPATEVE
jgi:drug/metabolite transporter (DMT)-like permease